MRRIHGLILLKSRSKEGYSVTQNLDSAKGMADKFEYKKHLKISLLHGKIH